jgi:type II secretory pathway component HofQ
MAMLDRELSEIRVAAASAPKNMPVQHALEVVPKQRIELTVEETTRFAALETTDLDASAVAPPARRTEPIVSNLRNQAAAQPEKMAVLRASDEAVVEAQASGRFRMAQAGTGVSVAEEPIRARQQPSADEPRRFLVPRSSKYRPDFDLYNPDLPPDQDPLQQIVDIDFRDMDLTNVVELLAQQAQINVIAGTELSGKVTANLKNVPLGRAFEIVLRLNGLGIVEEAGVYRITTYEEAVASRRETSMIFLRNAQAPEIEQSLNDLISLGADTNTVSVAANASTNVIMISGPRERVQELEAVVAELDVAEQVIPTLTVPIKLNYTEPAQMLPVIEKLVSESGKASADTRGRHIVVTDIPVKIQEIEAVIASIDIPVKQVSIESMIVDALMEDNAQTGVEWLLNSAQVVTPVAVPIGEGASIPEAAFGAALGDTALGSALSFGLVRGDIELTATVAAQVRNQNAELLANPTIVTVENQPATINITTEFPFQERTQTDGGGQIASTEFKEIGTILTVTPRVTHDDDIVATVDVKESTVIGFSETGVPIEAKRTADTTIRLNNGQTIYIGGLRSTNDTLTETKVPFLGDIPVLNTLFKSSEKGTQNIELLVFLTCEVLPFDYPELTPYEKTRYDKLGGIPMRPQGEKDLVNAYLHPERSRDPFYKWRRAK